MTEKSGHWSRVVKVVEQADVVMEVLDARFPERTRHAGLESLAREKGKKVLLVMNKADLVKKEKLEESRNKLLKNWPCLCVSAKQHEGSNALWAEISRLTGDQECKVGVCGYPNTGKSSIINYMKGRKVAQTSIKAGFTKGEKLVKVSEKVYLIDSPGIIPYEERDQNELVLVGAKNPEQVSDPLGAAEYLMEFIAQENPKAFEEFYGVGIEGKDFERILEEIAYRKRRLRVGGNPDLDVISRMLIMDWQKGRLKL
ncbi:MAG TPA: GTPase RsgA [Candidatus Diapherotrites archaeon]|uniref:50S ribosome-binding GTPase n=1 Tax=Candidatus Iainarchaeum sp. TaxID=3101447 RepID=A0A7J4JP52_9ARCH|nr:50S ribosome-binding GTPase [Candidatus Diapherotrites archaeon]HIH16976.1 GTPase RsgA [Candidatus Diapherotrites archaeon]